MQNGDIPLSRQTLEKVATKGNIYFTLTMALLSAVLFIAGLLQLRIAGPNPLAKVPDHLVFIGVGVVGFCLFFPWFTALYFARHLLLSVKKLEQEIAELRGEI